jgi:hypothetical protein
MLSIHSMCSRPGASERPPAFSILAIWLRLRPIVPSSAIERLRAVSSSRVAESTCASASAPGPRHTSLRAFRALRLGRTTVAGPPAPRESTCARRALSVSSALLLVELSVAEVLTSVSSSCRTSADSVLCSRAAMLWRRVSVSALTRHRTKTSTAKRLLLVHDTHHGSSGDAGHQVVSRDRSIDSRSPGSSRGADG